MVDRARAVSRDLPPLDAANLSQLVGAARMYLGARTYDVGHALHRRDEALAEYQRLNDSLAKILREQD